MSEQRLWEIKHAYYCNEGNFYANGCGSHFERWQDFMESEGDADLNYNLLFRFDFEPPYEDGDSDKPIKWQADENYRDCTLKLFYMGQRKGAYRFATVDVCRADEPMIREWLRTRFEYMMELWQPFSIAKALGETQ